MPFDPRAFSDIVSQDISMRCVGADGESMVLEATLRYDRRDPYAVSTTFRTEVCEVVWTFARDLLSGGLTGPVGEGDVHVWPSFDAAGEGVVIIELSSPDGELLAHAPADDVTRFVNRTLARVPAGTEGALIDVDSLIGQLLAI